MFYYLRLLICISLFQVICYIVPKKDEDKNRDPTVILIGIEQIVKELEKRHANDL